jgi:Uma2 family endonuclease
VKLVVEAVSPESAHRDRTVKLRKYAEAGIPH